MSLLSNSYKIRPANLQDVEQIERVMKDSMLNLGKGHYSDEQIQSACQFVCVADQQLILDGTYFVVEDQEHSIIACGGWSFRNKPFAGPKSVDPQDDILNPKKDMARIRAMFVSSKVSGLGLGSLILEYALTAAIDHGFSRAVLGATQSGLAFYKAKGWQVCSDEMVTLPDDVQLKITMMEKDLIK